MFNSALMALNMYSKQFHLYKRNCNPGPGLAQSGIACRYSPVQDGRRDKTAQAALGTLDQPRNSRRQKHVLDVDAAQLLIAIA